MCMYLWLYGGVCGCLRVCVGKQTRYRYCDIHRGMCKRFCMIVFVARHDIGCSWLWQQSNVGGVA